MVDKNYDDIINLPHHVSRKHPPMSLLARAAQFSPFAALTGHDAAIKETARLTNRQIELDDEVKLELNSQLVFLKENIKAHPVVSITYFKPDEKKVGGAYITATDAVKKIRNFEQEVVLSNGTEIPFDDIIEIEGEIFAKLH